VAVRAAGAYYGKRRLRAKVPAQGHMVGRWRIRCVLKTGWPNQVRAGDITYLPRQGGGWLYLVVWLDHCSRQIVGWGVRETMPEDLVSEALRRAPWPCADHPLGSLCTPTKTASSR
jgi:putative transposase